MIGRIPCKNPYSYIEIDGTETEAQILNLITLVDKYSAKHEEQKKEIVDSNKPTSKQVALIKKKAPTADTEKMTKKEASEFISKLFEVQQ